MKTRNRIANARKIKLPFSPEELGEFYEHYIEDKEIANKEQKHRLWWAMFYAAKEGREWKET